MRRCFVRASSPAASRARRPVESTKVRPSRSKTTWVTSSLPIADFNSPSSAAADAISTSPRARRTSASPSRSTRRVRRPSSRIRYGVTMGSRYTLVANSPERRRRENEAVLSRYGAYIRGCGRECQPHRRDRQCELPDTGGAAGEARCTPLWSPATSPGWPVTRSVSRKALSRGGRKAVAPGGAHHLASTARAFVPAPAVPAPGQPKP